MSKIMRSLNLAGARVSPGMAASSSRAMRRRSYGRLGPNGMYETTSVASGYSPFSVRVPRRLRILGLGNRGVVGNRQLQLGGGVRAPEPSPPTVFGRLRVAYERVMTRAASKSAVSIAKASRAPPTLAAAFGSRAGVRMNELNPGFRMTSVEKKYLDHLKKSVSGGRM